MSHLDEVIARVDAAIEESVIAHITVASIKKIWKRATNS